MNHWQSFLTQQGAQWENEQLVGFAGSQNNHPVKLTSLENHGILMVSGPEAEKFLQGQCTCDMSRLANNDVLLGAHCNHKGRMLSSFHAFLIAPDTVALRMHKSILDTTLNALKKYSVFSKVELHIEPQYQLLGLWGEQTKAFTDTQMPTPSEDGKGLSGEAGFIIRHNSDRMEICVRAAAAEPLWQQWAQQCSLASPSEWDAACIRAGVGEIRAETIEAFIPQMLNFQKIDGISFNKGCYTGQEVVARMHYRGKLKKHMYRATMSSPHPIPKPGAPVYSLTDGAKNIGTVVMAAKGQEQAEILFVSPNNAQENSNIFLDKDSRVKLSWSSLPYAIT